MENKKTLRNIVGIAAFCILLYWGLQNLNDVAHFVGTINSLLTPFFLGGAMAFIFNVPMRAIERHIPKKMEKVRRPMSLTLTLLAVVGVLMVVFLLVVPQLQETVQKIIRRLPAFWVSVQDYMYQLMTEYPALSEWLKEPVSIDWASLTKNAVNWMQTSGLALVGNTVSAATGIISGFVSFFIGFIFAIYLLSQKEALGRQGKMLLYAWLPEKKADKVLEVAALTNRTFSNFLSGQCLEACILGCLFAIGMLLFHMPYVLLVSVLVAVTALIPVFGAFIGCFVGAFLILIDNPMQAVVYVILFFVIQQIEGNLIYPRVVGNSVGLPSIWVLAAVTLGGSTMGVVGMLVMIPLCSVLYSLLRTATRNKLREKGIARMKYAMQADTVPGKGKSALKAKK